MAVDSSLHPDVARGFAEATRKKRASFIERKALYAATLVEARGQNLPYGDRDSVGALQQRPSQGWKHAMNPEGAAEDFLTQARRIVQQHPEWNSAQVAQAVQRSAFPARYGARDVQSQAQALARGGAGGGFGATSVTGPDRTSVTLGTKIIPGQSFAAERQAAAGQLLTGQQGLPSLGALLQYKGTINSLKDVPERRVSGDLKVSTKHGRRVTVPASGAGGGGKGGHIKITGASPERIQPAVRSFMRSLSRISGETIVGDSGATHSRLTTSGRVSQHTTGDAVDIPATGERLIRLGQLALMIAGMPRRQALKQRGGLFNVNGRQVIFNTQQGGDHTNHLHFGD